MDNGHISGDLTNGLTQSSMYSFPIQTNLRCCQTNFPAGKLCQPPIRNEKPKSPNPRSNKQTNYKKSKLDNEHIGIWRPHKRTNTILHVQLPYPNQPPMLPN